MPLEVLHLPLVLFRCRTGRERSQISTPAGLGIDLARVQPVAAGCQFTNHRAPAFEVSGRDAPEAPGVDGVAGVNGGGRFVPEVASDPVRPPAELEAPS